MKDEIKLHVPDEHGFIITKMPLLETSDNIITPETLAAARSDFGIQVFMPNGREFTHGYQPRNIIQVKQFHYDYMPNGRIWPTGEYSGNFRWLVQNYNISVPWRGVFYVIHGDGSLEWRAFMWDNAGGGAPPSNWHGAGMAGNILGIVER